MMRSIAPFVVANAASVTLEPWNRVHGGVTEPLPEIVDGWDYATDLTLHRTARVDLPELIKSCELPEGTQLGWVVTWRAEESKLVGSSPVAPVDDGECTLSVFLPGAQLGARISLSTKIVLTAERNGAHDGTARHVGSVLFEEARSCTLLGDLAQFPIAVIDFSAAGLDPDASIVVEIDDDPDTPALAGIQLLINSADTELVAAASATIPDNPRHTMLLADLGEQVARQLLIHAVRHADELGAGTWEPGTIGSICTSLAGRVDRVSGLEGLALAERDAPSLFQSLLAGEARRTGLGRAIR